MPAVNELGHGATVNKLEVIASEEATRLDIIAKGRIDSQDDFDENYFDPFKFCSCI